MASGEWVDFKAVKAAVNLQMLVDHYGLRLRKSGQELRGRCPFHEGGGNDTLHVNVGKGAFQCFADSCKARGNVLDFVAAKEGCSIREAALKLKEWFGVSTAGAGAGAPAEPESKSEQGTAEGVGEREGNKPLGFALKGVDSSHPYLERRGISRLTAELFGVGFYAGKGSMSGRVVFPIRNAAGELVGYAGRAIDDSEPKYKFPAGFDKSAELYNLERAWLAGGLGRHVLVVEGFFDCLKVWQAGFPAVVALMGCSVSDEQEELLCRFERVTLMLDGDDAGRAAAGEITLGLARRVFVKVLDVGPAKQPDMLTVEELRGLLG